MEPIFGVLVLFIIFLAATISSSSDRDERRPPRDGYPKAPVRSTRQRAYRDEDWDDDYDNPDPYPPPYAYRKQRRRGKGVLLGFFFAVILVSAVAVYAWDGTPHLLPNLPKPETILEGTVKGLAPEAAKILEMPVPDDPKPVPPAKMAYEYLSKPHMICLGKSDYVSFQSIQKTYPDRKIEAYLDENGRYWICIFAETSEALDTTVTLLRLREEDLMEHGLGIVYYKTSDLCSGIIVKEKGTDIWFCKSEY